MHIQTGFLRKMQAKLANPIQYNLLLDSNQILLNNYLGKEIELNFTGKISCINCNRIIKKSYQQGFCFPCTQRLAACDFCIVKPETCHYHLGTCREPQWGEQHCLKPHIIYLANSSGLKVGITREKQIPTRWIDQGAIQALPIIKVHSRYHSGLVEKAIAKSIPDKTNWRKMLKFTNNKDAIDLIIIRESIFASDIIKLNNFKFTLELLNINNSLDLHYPVLTTPNVIKSINLNKVNKISGILQGIKGQYLIFDLGVINIRNFAGYQVELKLPKISPPID